MKGLYGTRPPIEWGSIHANYNPLHYFMIFDANSESISFSNWVFVKKIQEIEVVEYVITFQMEEFT